MSALVTPRTSRAISRSPVSPYGITSVGSPNDATPSLMSSMQTSSAHSSLGQIASIHKLGCLKPRTTRDLLNVTTNHASSEEAVGAVFSGGWDKAKAKHMDPDEGPSTQRGKKNKTDRR